MDLSISFEAKLHGLPFLITTTRRYAPEQERHALALAARTGQSYIARDIGGLATLATYARDNNLVDDDVTGILVVRQKDYVFWISDEVTFQYHPGMAVHRIKALALGREDPMIEAMQLKAGDSVLDCTAGLCSDALVASHVVGDSGHVLGLEVSLPAALVVYKGLQTYESDRKDIVPAMRRLHVHATRAGVALSTMESHSWDIVYFDPMFVQPVTQSIGIAPLRSIADPTPLSLDTLQEAARVARRAVVVKDRVHGPWLTSPNVTRVVGGANRRVGYAVFEGDERVKLLEGVV